MISRVAAGNDPVAEGFDGCRRIDVGHRLEIPAFRPQFLLKRRQFVRRATVRQRTACQQIRHQDRFLRAENLRGFSHEVNAAEHNRRFCDLRGVPGQLQTVARIVGDILQIAVHVKVSQDHRVLLDLQTIDFVHQIERIFVLFSSGRGGDDRKGHGTVSRKRSRGAGSRKWSGLSGTSPTRRTSVTFTGPGLRQ